MTPISSAEIKALLSSARIRESNKVNVADVLAKSGHLVVQDPKSRLWRLTDAGLHYLSDDLGLEFTMTSRSTATVRTTLVTISDPVVKSFVEESILCLEVGALRASVVFLWSAAIRTLQELALLKHKATITQALQKHDQKCQQVTSMDGFSRVKDSIALLGFRELGMLDKGQYATLKEALDLRNRCGHPTSYKPGPQKVSAFIEDIVGIVF
jgi:hypothetical protein